MAKITTAAEATNYVVQSETAALPGGSASAKGGSRAPPKHFAPAAGKASVRLATKAMTATAAEATDYARRFDYDHPWATLLDQANHFEKFIHDAKTLFTENGYNYTDTIQRLQETHHLRITNMPLGFGFRDATHIEIINDTLVMKTDDNELQDRKEYVDDHEKENLKKYDRMYTKINEKIRDTPQLANAVIPYKWIVPGSVCLMQRCDISWKRTPVHAYEQKDKLQKFAAFTATTVTALAIAGIDAFDWKIENICILRGRYQLIDPDMLTTGALSEYSVATYSYHDMCPSGQPKEGRPPLVSTSWSALVALLLFAHVEMGDIKNAALLGEYFHNNGCEQFQKYCLQQENKNWWHNMAAIMLFGKEKKETVITKLADHVKLHEQQLWRDTATANDIKRFWNGVPKIFE